MKTAISFLAALTIALPAQATSSWSVGYVNLRCGTLIDAIDANPETREFHLYSMAVTVGSYWTGRNRERPDNKLKDVMAKDVDEVALNTLEYCRSNRDTMLIDYWDMLFDQLPAHYYASS